MEKYISFLRGINVGGHHILKMNDLKKIHTEMGHRNVNTYLQSGNVIYETSVKSRGKLTSILEKNYQKAFGFHIDVITCKLLELQKIVKECPFPINKNVESKLINIIQLSDIPDSELASVLIKHGGPEEKHIVGNVLYVYYKEGSGRSKFNLNYIERTLNVKGTARNWNTITRLIELAQE